jgi:hypothetical protein
MALPLVDRRAFLQLQIDAIEAAAPTEYLLGGVIHHRKISANAGQPPERMMPRTVSLVPHHR